MPRYGSIKGRNNRSKLPSIFKFPDNNENVSTEGNHDQTIDEEIVHDFRGIDDEPIVRDDINSAYMRGANGEKFKVDLKVDGKYLEIY